MDLPVKTELPDQKWYTINQVAERWGRSEDYVLHQIQTYDLNPSFYFGLIKCNYTLFLSDYEEHFASGQPREVEIPELVSPIGGNWNNNRILITTKSKWTSDLSECYFLAGPPRVEDIKLSADQEISEWTVIYSPMKPAIVGVDDLVISNEELQRFEANALRKINATKETDQIETKDDAFLDPNHKYHSKELAAAVKVWRTLYGNEKIISNKGHKDQIKACLGGYGFSNAAIDRIATVVNPNKDGGAPASI